MTLRLCPTCKHSYEDGGDSWKKQCYDCYKKYKGRKRIQKLGYKSDVYITHPDVTKEELDAYIMLNHHEHGWGAEEYVPKDNKYKIWLNNTNYD